jgi:hypothetical protein
MKFGRTVNQKDIAAYHRHRKVQHEKHKKYFQNSTKPRHESSEEHGIVFDSDAAAKHLPSARSHCIATASAPLPSFTGALSVSALCSERLSRPLTVLCPTLAHARVTC